LTSTKVSGLGAARRQRGQDIRPLPWPDLADILFEN
jgi:hypothetical protein